MANAVCRITYMGGSNGRVGISLGMTITGTSIELPEGPIDTEKYVEFDGSTTAVQIKQLMGSAVTERATELDLVIPLSNMLLPTFQKG